MNIYSVVPEKKMCRKILPLLMRLIQLIIRISKHILKILRKISDIIIKVLADNLIITAIAAIKLLHINILSIIIIVNMKKSTPIRIKLIVYARIIQY